MLWDLKWSLASKAGLSSRGRSTGVPEDGHNKSLDASGGSVFLNLFGAAEGALIRAAASTQPFAGLHPWKHRRCKRIGHISKLSLDRSRLRTTQKYGRSSTTLTQSCLESRGTSIVIAL